MVSVQNGKPGIVRVWIEAMRLRTLPVSLAGVVAAAGYARLIDSVDITVFILCLVFATLAQISSNFANEYFDFKAGIDKVGRDGPRRGVTEGDITPRAMKSAVFVTLGVACAVGLSLIAWGGWTMILYGVFIAVGVFAYSAGPFPLSRYCLGEVMVVAFFGLAPVMLTFYLMAGYVDPLVTAGSIAVGLMGANVLLVNNIRDIDDDRAVGKHTLPSVLGRRFGSFLYLANGWIAVWLMGSAWLTIGKWSTIAPGVYLVAHTVLWYCVSTKTGKTLNRILGMTATLMALYALAFLILS